MITEDSRETISRLRDTELLVLRGVRGDEEAGVLGDYDPVLLPLPDIENLQHLTNEKQV